MTTLTATRRRYWRRQLFLLGFDTDQLDTLIRLRERYAAGHPMDRTAHAMSAAQRSVYEAGAKLYGLTLAEYLRGLFIRWLVLHRRVGR